MSPLVTWKFTLIYTACITAAIAAGWKHTVRMSAPAGGNAILPCELDGEYDVRKVTWYSNNNGRTLTNGFSQLTNRYRIIHKNASRMDLEIKNVSTFDDGLYLCKYMEDNVNEVHLTVNDSIITAVYRPDGYANLKSLVREENVTVVAGDKTEFTCSTRGMDAKKIKWFFTKSGDDKPTLLYKRPKLQGTDLILTFSSLDRTDDGLYECVYISPNGHQKVLLLKRLIVQERVKILEHSENKSVRRGDSISLWCNATGNPEPHITWQKISDEDGDPEHEELHVNGPMLGLANVSVYCGGKYECTATNTIEDQSQKATEHIIVEVLYKPIILVEESGRDDSYSRRLLCMVLANPNATGVWYDMSGEEILENNIKYHLESSYVESHYGTEAVTHTKLSIRETPITQTIYTCNATNRYGSSEFKFPIDP